MKRLVAKAAELEHEYNGYTLRQKRVFYYAMYTLLFAVLASFFFSGILFSRHTTFSLIWQSDGRTQHYLSLAFWGEYLRGLLRGVGLPLWDFSIGYGADILTTLHYYVIGDPLTLVSALVPLEHTEALYNVLLIFRFYLAGLAFSFYCHHMGRDGYGVLFGAFVYVFCGYAMFYGIRHPFFLNPMIYFPLLLVGAEKIFKQNKPLLFVVCVALSAASSFYFFYMLTIFVVLYALLRYFFRYKADGSGFWRLLGRFSLYYGIGLCMACVIFLPNAMKVLSASRLQVTRPIEWVYSLQYYLTLLVQHILPNVRYYGSALGYANLIFPSVVLLFLHRKNPANRQLLIALAVLFGFQLFPFVSSALNGFSYVANRWVWAYGFAVALAVVYSAPLLLALNRKERLQLAAASLAYYTLIILVAVWAGGISARECLYFGLLLALLLVILAGSRFLPRRAGYRHVALVVVLALLSVNVVLNGEQIVADTSPGFVEQDLSLTGMLHGSDEMLPSAAADDFYRYEESEHSGFVLNKDLLSRRNSVAYYFSMADPSVFQLLRDVDFYDMHDFNYKNQDGRAALGALSATRYYIAPRHQFHLVPYGYQETGLATEYDYVQYYAFENQYALPFGYTYRTVIPEEQFRALHPLQRQEAMLQGIVLQGAAPVGMETTTLELASQRLAYEITDMQNITQEGGLYQVPEGMTGSMTLAFEGLPDSELYLRVANLHGVDAEFMTLTVQAGGITKNLYASEPIYFAYTGKQDAMVNMGYSETGLGEATILFPPGSYSFDALEVLCQPMEGFAAQIEALRSETLENLAFDTNRVSGSISLSEDRVLCLAMPFSKGWSARVNGEPAPLLQANSMYTALVLPAGEHEIELVYETPYLRAGAVLSLLGVLACAGLLVYRRKKRQKAYATADKNDR